MYKLKEYPLSYEDMPSDSLIKKITDRTRTFKLKSLREGWVAQIRVYHDGNREEVSVVGNSPKEAVTKLDKRMIERGIYNVQPIHDR